MRGCTHVPAQLVLSSRRWAIGVHPHGAHLLQALLAELALVHLLLNAACGKERKKKKKGGPSPRWCLREESAQVDRQRATAEHRGHVRQDGE